ncbi:MAG TPA: hypothetical protein VEI73_04370 [Candidatus Acidoferrum sp.]|nr:hypothetical protein [Candidatus Acidoferrum sp.]
MNNTLSTPLQAPTEELTKVQRLTREYARFSRDAAGLGHVMGGALIFLVVFLVAHRPVNAWEGIVLGTTPLVWIISKEWLRRRYYQFSGRVTQRERRWHDLILGLLAGFFAVLILAVFLVQKPIQPFSWKSAVTSAVCIAVLLTMPVVVWRYLRAPYEFVPGVFLLALSAFLLSGNIQIASRVAGAFGIVAEIVAVVMILAGYTEHMKFLKLRRKLSAMKEPT